MKIAIVNRHVQDFLGGSEMQCDGLAKGLTERGHTVTYIAPAGREKHDYQTDYRVVATASTGEAIAQAVLESTPDIVYWRLNKYHFYRACKTIGRREIPIVFAVSHVSDTRRWSTVDNPRAGVIQMLRACKQGLKNCWNHQGFRYVRGVTVINTEHLGLLPVERQTFIPNFVDETPVVFDWPRPFVLWVANIKPAKRPELFIKLAKEFEKSGVDFLMVGAIQSTDYEWIKKGTDTPSNFHYLGAKTIQEVNGICAKCLSLVHTCRPEGFGNIFIQAWLKAKPTLTLEFDPCGYIQGNDLGGCAIGDFDSLVTQTKTLIENEELRELKGQKALAFAQQTFSASRTVGALEDFLGVVLNQASQMKAQAS